MDKTMEIILKNIWGKREQLSEALANGAAKDFSEYQKLCGEIRGLSVAEGYIKDLAKQMEQSDE